MNAGSSYNAYDVVCPISCFPQNPLTLMESVVMHDDIRTRKVLSLRTGHPYLQSHIRMSLDSRLLYVSGILLDQVEFIFPLCNAWTIKKPTWIHYDEIDEIFSALYDMRPSFLCSIFNTNVDVSQWLLDLSDVHHTFESDRNRYSPHVIYELWDKLNGSPFMRPEETPLFFGSSPNATTCFTTRDGLLGVFMSDPGSSVRPGDSLALLYGAAGPAVLRASGGTYELHGFPLNNGLEDILHYRFRHSDFTLVEVEAKGQRRLREVKTEEVGLRVNSFLLKGRENEDACTWMLRTCSFVLICANLTRFYPCV